MILVRGAAGNVGSETVRPPRQRELPARAQVRSPDKAAGLPEAGGEIANGDLEAPPAIHEAMQGARGVVLVAPGMPPLELNVMHSAMRAGAEHVARISGITQPADSPSTGRRGHAQNQAALAASGLVHTIVQQAVGR